MPLAARTATWVSPVPAITAVTLTTTAFQAEFRANNLFKQLTIRSGYTFAKTTDNVNEIFTQVLVRKPLRLLITRLIQTGEHSFSGLDIPHQWRILFTEDLRSSRNSMA